MNDAIKMGMGVAGGYVLGRMKMLKLGLRLATWVVSREAGMPPDELVEELTDKARSAGARVERPTKDAVTTARRASGLTRDEGSEASLGGRIAGLADRLHERNESRRQTAGAGS